MWIVLAICSAFGLGVYDVMKKLSVEGNNVLIVLMFNTLFGMLLLVPFIVVAGVHGDFGFGDDPAGHGLILIKSAIVLSSWLLGYFAIKHLPLTVQGPINASRPVMVLVGAVLIFGERLNVMQWAGILLGFVSLFLMSRIGAKEGFSMKRSMWIWMSIGAAVLGAVSGLYDKYLLRRYDPIEVQSWYAFYQWVIMSVVILSLRRWFPGAAGVATRFRWRWTIPLIAVFLTLADVAYFYSLSYDESMVSVVSMIRRGSVVVPFVYGAVVLREKNVGTKTLDLGILIVSLLLLVAGS